MVNKKIAELLSFILLMTAPRGALAVEDNAPRCS